MTYSLANQYVQDSAKPPLIVFPQLPTPIPFSASGKYYTATGSDIVPKDGKKCWLKGGAYKPYFTYDKTVW